MRMAKARALIRLALLVVFLGAVAGASPVSERQIAEWVIRQGGQVQVNGQRHVIADLSHLPAAPFRITGIDLIGTTIDPQDLSKLAALSNLVELSLPGPIFTPFSDSPLDANSSLKQLAGLTKLQRLFVSLHFLPTYNLDDAGISYLSPLINLRELRLSQSSVKTPNLSPFTRLESLDLSDSPYFGDGGMATLEGMKNLRRLYLRNDPITDAGLRHLSGLTGLQELDLYGARVTDEGMESLRNLSSLRKLNLLGA